MPLMPLTRIVPEQCAEPRKDSEVRLVRRESACVTCTQLGSKRPVDWTGYQNLVSSGESSLSIRNMTIFEVKLEN